MLKMKFSGLCLIYFFVYVKAQRIAGGTETNISEYPFATSLQTNGGNTAATFAHACGGTILTANSILSAASCFHTNGVLNQAAWWRARVGSSQSNAGGTIYNIRLITSHPDFSATTRNNDIAVIRTTYNIVLRPGSVEAARIAGGAYTFARDQPIVAIGWGAVSATSNAPSDNLRRVQYWSIEQETCVNRYTAVGFTVTPNMVCVGWHDIGIRGQCTGDYGSPIIDEDGAVVGLFTHAEGCADPVYPDINTRVSSFTRWIVATATA